MIQLKLVDLALAKAELDLDYYGQKKPATNLLGDQIAIEERKAEELEADRAKFATRISREGANLRNRAGVTFFLFFPVDTSTSSCSANCFAQIISPRRTLSLS